MRRNDRHTQFAHNAENMQSKTNNQPSSSSAGVVGGGAAAAAGAGARSGNASFQAPLPPSSPSSVSLPLPNDPDQSSSQAGGDPLQFASTSNPFTSSTSNSATAIATAIAIGGGAQASPASDLSVQQQDQLNVAFEHHSQRASSLPAAGLVAAAAGHPFTSSSPTDPTATFSSYLAAGRHAASDRSSLRIPSEANFASFHSSAPPDPLQSADAFGSGAASAWLQANQSHHPQQHSALRHQSVAPTNVALFLRRFSHQRNVDTEQQAARLAQRRQTLPSTPSQASAPLLDPTRLYHVPGLAASASNPFSQGIPAEHLASSSSNSNSHPQYPTSTDEQHQLLARSFSSNASLYSMQQAQAAHMLQRGASAGSASGYKCPNCAKTFARDDLLRRHLAREARAAAQPSLDRQKSCFECARSKARCDLEVPSCGRCRARGKQCTYGARSGNPNVRKNSDRSSSAAPQGMDAHGMHPPASWNVHDPMAPHAAGPHTWQTGGMIIPGPGQGVYAFPKNEGSVSEEYESDDSRAWSGSFHHHPQQQQDSHQFQHRHDRTLSSSSSNYNSESQRSPQQQQQQQQPQQQFPIDAVAYLPPAYGRPTTSIDTGVQRSRVEDDEATPVNPVGVMGPPLITPNRTREAATTTSSSLWLGDSVRPPPSATSLRPQIPRLLTGARMPRPPEAGQASARPLFSAQLDLSGWLEEPVIPSPLYRMGPSLSALGASGQSFILPTPTMSTQQNPNLHPNAAAMIASDTIMQHDSGARVDRGSATTNASQQAQVAARMCWAAGPQERSAVDAQEVAQACAGHFTLYPALMVLPDATSPVPPLFHRPWLAFTRAQTPPALAMVRVALAAYHVRLPASESMIWEMIRSQAKAIVASYDALAQSSDMEVFSSTAALWFLVILLLMSTDPGSGQGVDDGLTDSCLVGLSHLARLLLQRVLARERAMSTSQPGENGASNAAPPTSFFEWGFLETMRRTLFACYALFVLQRFRTTSPELQSRLAGAELVLDIKLPATASEFEAGDELEWRAAQHVKITDDQESALSGALTLRELLQARTVAQQESQERAARRRQSSAASTSTSTSSSISPPTSKSSSGQQQQMSGEAGETNTGGGDGVAGGSSAFTGEEGVARASSPEAIDNPDAASPVTEERRKQMLAYFDRHDDFTNVCLTVTFALDARI